MKWDTRASLLRLRCVFRYRLRNYRNVVVCNGHANSENPDSRPLTCLLHPMKSMTEPFTGAQESLSATCSLPSSSPLPVRPVRLCRSLAPDRCR